MGFTPEATYKGRFITEMNQHELIEALHDQILEARFMMQFINLKSWHEALQERAEKEMGLDQAWVDNENHTNK